MDRIVHRIWNQDGNARPKGVGKQTEQHDDICQTTPVEEHHQEFLTRAQEDAGKDTGRVAPQRMVDCKGGHGHEI